MRIRNRIFLFLFLLCFMAVSARPEQVKDVKVLGNPGKTDVLFDGVIDRKNYIELDLKASSGPSLVLLLGKPAAIRALRLHLVTPVPSMKISAEFSGDLFNWEKIRSVNVKSGSKNGTVAVDLETGGRTALFMRLVFTAPRLKSLRISEVQAERDAAASVNNVRVNLVSASENSLTVRLVADADVIASVKYGETLSGLADGPVIANYGRGHVIVIPGLLKGTGYYVVGTGQDCNGNLKYSRPMLFRTSGVPLPRIRAVDTAGVTSGSFRCSVAANVETACSVSAGYSPDSLKIFRDGAFDRRHGLFFTNLAQESDLFFRIGLEDKAGNRTESGLLKVRTRPANLGRMALISGDFRYVGENLGPEFLENAAARLADNDFSYLNGSVMSGDILSGDQELVFDFKESLLVGRIDLVQWALAYATECDVYAGRDGMDWTLLKGSNMPDPGIRYDFIANIPYLVTRIPVGQNLRFIKIVFKQGDFKARFPEYRNLRLLEVLAVPETAEKDGFRVIFD